MTAVVPPMGWCGVDHPHGPHTYVMPSGLTGFWKQCPGSTGSDEATLRRQWEAELGGLESRLIARVDEVARGDG